MAPIFVFTAEEIWQHMPKEKNTKTFESVHLLSWPRSNPLFSQKDLAARGEDIESELRRIIELIPAVTKTLEEKRSQGLIGSSFDAEIILLTNRESCLSYLTRLKPELREIFKVSAVEIRREGEEEISLIVQKAKGNKCARCWNYYDNVGNNKQHPTICEECLNIIGGIDEEKNQ
jgi:isoleucyl-tRNA synthetase